MEVAGVEHTDPRKAEIGDHGEHLPARERVGLRAHGAGRQAGAHQEPAAKCLALGVGVEGVSLVTSGLLAPFERERKRHWGERLEELRGRRRADDAAPHQAVEPRFQRIRHVGIGAGKLALAPSVRARQPVREVAAPCRLIRQELPHLLGRRHALAHQSIDRRALGRGGIVGQHAPVELAGIVQRPHLSQPGDPGVGPRRVGRGGRRAQAEPSRRSRRHHHAQLLIGRERRAAARYVGQAMSGAAARSISKTSPSAVTNSDSAAPGSSNGRSGSNV